MTGLSLSAAGRYGQHEAFTNHWTDPDRQARLFWQADEPAGFAIIQRVPDGTYDMEQFMILRKFRRQGLGTTAAKAIFEAFTGDWSVEQIAENPAAISFWRKVISAYTNGHFNDTGGEGPVQSFTSPPGHR